MIAQPTPNFKMDLSAPGEHKIANHEGFKDHVYDDKTGKPWAVSKLGKPTIGFGHLIPQDHTDALLEHFHEPMSREDGEILFKKDLKRYIAAVQISTHVPLNQNQFDALVSLVYNIGAGNFGSSTLLKRLNTGDYQGAAEHFLDWRYDGHHEPVLLSRRQEERLLFLTPC